MRLRKGLNCTFALDAAGRYPGCCVLFEAGLSWQQRGVTMHDLSVTRASLTPFLTRQASGYSMPSSLLPVCVPLEAL